MDGDRSFELYERGRESLRAGKLESAIADLQLSAAAWPHFKTLELLGEALIRAERFAEAVVPLAAAATLNRNVRALLLLSDCFLSWDSQGMPSASPNSP